MKINISKRVEYDSPADGSNSSEGLLELRIIIEYKNERRTPTSPEYNETFETYNSFFTAAGTYNVLIKTYHKSGHIDYEFLKI